MAATPWPPTVVSMSTVPWRLARIPALVETLHRALPRAAIVINIPVVLKRTGASYGEVPAGLAELPYVIVQRCDDVGPITKVLPTFTLTRELPDVVILSLDDDMCYDTAYLHWVLDAWCARSRVCPGTVLSGDYSAEYFRGAVLIQGYAGIIYPRRVITERMLREMLACTLGCEACFTSDDIVISTILQSHGVSLCGAPEQDVHATRLRIASGPGTEPGALQVQQNHRDAYVVARRAMASAWPALVELLSVDQYARGLGGCAPEAAQKLAAWLYKKEG